MIKEIFFVRRNTYFLSAFLFLYYNWGYSYHAFRTTFSIVMFNRWGKDVNGIALGPQSPEYQELYNAYNMDALAGTITAALLAIFGLMLVMRVLDFIHSFDSALTRDTRHLQKWVRQETKHLDNQGRILTTLRLDQDAKVKAFQTIKRMEDILLRYEQRAAMLNPNVPKPQQLSKREETFRDLFSDPEKNKPGEKSKKGLRKLKFKPKF